MGQLGVKLSGTNAVLDGITGNVDFSGVNLAGVSFMNSDLSAAMFDANTVFSARTPTLFSKKGPTFPAPMRCSTALPVNVDFSGVNLAGVSFMNSDLSTAMFDPTPFRLKDLIQPLVKWLNWSQSFRHQCGARRPLNGPVDFRGVNLAGVSFMNSDLSTAMFDHTTTFSAEGFDPTTGQMAQLGVNLSGTNAVLDGITGQCRFQGGQSRRESPSSRSPIFPLRCLITLHRFRHQCGDRNPLRLCRLARGQPHLSQP